MTEDGNQIARNAQLWLPGYLRSRAAALLRPSPAGEPVSLWVAIADHFEPLWQGADQATARRRVCRWRTEWPRIAARHNDSRGRPPQYTFFYPEEEYQPGLLEPLAEMAEAGIADVEVHLHHDGEGEADFVSRLSRFTAALHERHGRLRRQNGKIAFGFIHGNHALDNSRSDGRWCGLNNEITLLRDLGCYADFTMPSAPSSTQCRMVNSIYWAIDDPLRPKSHDTGVPVVAGGGATGDLLMIPGPLGFNWLGRRRLLFPRTETGELAAYDRPTPHRAKLWLRYAPRIGPHVFLKLFTHGAQERNADTLLTGDLDLALRYLREECERRAWRLHFASAWDMYQAVEAVRHRKPAAGRDG